MPFIKVTLSTASCIDNAGKQVMSVMQGQNPELRIVTTEGGWVNLYVNIQNKGGSPVAIMYIEIEAEWGKERVIRRALIREPIGAIKGVSRATGPPLPFTVNGYHSQGWLFELGRVIEPGNSERSGVLFVKVTPSVGKKIQEKREFSIGYSSSPIDRIR